MAPQILESLRVDDRKVYEYKIDAHIYENFRGLFKDFNQLHIDENFAVKRGFKRKIMYGGILNGFISHFIGMHFPGNGSVIESVNIDYKSPCYLNDVIRIEGRIEQKSDAMRVVVLRLALINLTQNSTCAKAKVQVGLR